MYGQAHAGLGWILGTFAPGSDRRLRIWCAAAAILPDIDCAPIIFGHDAYARWHHTFGHNVFLGALTVAAAVWHHRDRPIRGRAWAAIMVGLCFASHILTDMKFSGWALPPLWPLSKHEVQFHPNYQLGHPINFFLVYSLMILPFLLAFVKPVTPLEILSARLDRIVLNFFRRRTLACATCGTTCNNRCDACQSPACMKDSRVDWRFRVTCAACPKPGQVPEAG
jgi:hypothetical protein